MHLSAMILRPISSRIAKSFCTISGLIGTSTVYNESSGGPSRVNDVVMATLDLRAQLQQSSKINLSIVAHPYRHHNDQNAR